MRVRTLVMAGVTTLALAASVAMSPGAIASASHPATLAAGFHGKAVAHPVAPLKGKCNTAFGSELPTPDGLIAWNDTTGTGFNTAGASDVKCGRKKRTRTIGKVTVNGYFGAVQELFNVTFYKNDPADGTSEPADNGIICSYTNLPGAAGGQYPTHVTTVLTLPTKCLLPKGTSWVAVQNNDINGPWYWEMQVEQQGIAKPDWEDVNNLFGSGCTNWSNDRYLIDCLGYDYGDFMLVLN